MAEHIIEVRVDEKIASVVGDPLYVCGNSDYIVKFHFDAEWAGHETKTARFIKSNKEYIDVLFSGDQCAVPIIDNTPYVRIGVYAGNLCTTTAAIVNAQRSILCGSGVPADPDPDIYTQMLEKLDELYLKDVKSDTEKLGGRPASDYAIKSETAPASHVSARNNPHGVTAEQIAAMSSHTKTIDDWNTAIYNGFYASSASCINSPTAGSQFHGMMINYSSVLGNQFVFKTWTDGVSEMWTRRYYNGEFGAWECLNPPMLLGVEYRTTERCQGKPVYAKLIDVGYLPNASKKVLNGVIVSGIEELVDMECVTTGSWVRRKNDSRVNLEMGVEQPYAWITLTTQEDMSAYTARILLKWTKP